MRVIEAQWYAARWSIGVIGLIMDGIQPARVADQIIDDLRKRERNGLIELSQRSGLKPGDRVRLLRGPFAGHLVIFAGMKPRERVEVLLTFLGAQQRVTLSQDDVERVQY
jgi:transcriptional antiterminator RfaH